MCVVYATSTKSCFERKAFLRIQLIKNIFNNIFDVIQNIHNKAEGKLKLEPRGKLFTIMSLFKVFQKLKSSVQKRPLLFNSMIYGSFYTGAEFAQQTYSKIFKFSLSPVSANIEETNTFEIKKPLSLWIRNFNQKLGLLDENNSAQSRSYNWAQLKRYAIYGCFIAGPILHGWYKWLDIFYKGQTIKIVLTKLLVDQFILTPPLITLFFISMSLMEGKSNLLDECKAKFLQTFKTSCMYWLPVQFLNFLLVPSALRVSFVSIAAFCWVNILCYLKSIPVSECNSNQIKY